MGKHGGTGGNCHRVVLVVPLLFHGGNEHAADGGGVGTAGALDTAEDHGGKHVYMAQTAGEEAHRCVRKVYQLIGDLGLHNNVARRHKEGDGQQGKAVHTSEHLDDGQAHGVAFGNNKDDSGDQQGHKNGKSQKDKDQQNQEDQKGH